MADLGLDLYGVDDLTADGREVSGRLCLIQAIARRLRTPRGALWYDPDYGYDVRRFLNAPPTAAGELANNVESEAEKDERVSQARATASFSGDTLTIRLDIADSGGPFSFVLKVTDVTVELLTQV
jgi:hypothetical protein